MSFDYFFTAGLNQEEVLLVWAKGCLIVNFISLRQLDSQHHVDAHLSRSIHSFIDVIWIHWHHKRVAVSCSLYCKMSHASIALLNNLTILSIFSWMPKVIFNKLESFSLLFLNILIFFFFLPRFFLFFFEFLTLE